MIAKSQRLSAAAILLAVAFVGSAVLLAATPARASHDTVLWSGFWNVSGTGAASEDWVQTLTDGNGKLYVFYVGSVGGVSNIYVSRYATGSSFGIPAWEITQRVNDVLNVVIPWTFFDVTMDHDGALYVAWVRSTVSDGAEVYVSKSIDDGQNWAAAVRANAPSPVTTTSGSRPVSSCCA